MKIKHVICMLNGSDRVWILFGKKKSGEASPSELQELERLLREMSLTDHATEVVDQLWQAKLYPNLPADPDEALWDRIEHRISPPLARRVRMRAFRIGIAVALAGLLGLSLFLFNRQAAPPTDAAKAAGNQFSTPSGSKSKVQLPDGTEVWLNAESKLSMGNGIFGAETREVFLSGEAFFDVVKNDKVPFVIHTGIIDITVRGTAFNVKAYPGAKTIETSLVRGRIEITTRLDPDRKIILKPNEKIIIPTDTSAATAAQETGTATSSVYEITALHKGRSGVLPETVWLNPRLEFDDEAFSDLAPKIEEWFNIRIRFTGNATRDKHFSGIIEKETLPETLKAMQLSYPFTYSLKGKELIIY